jgi:hypothetical protein
MTSAAAIAVVPIPSANLLLRELVTGYVSLCNAASMPVSVSASSARDGEVVQANALADDVFTLTAAEPISKNSFVERASQGLVRPTEAQASAIGWSVTGAASAGDRLLVAVQLSALTGGGFDATGAGFIPPTSDAPNGVITGTERGQVYSQLDPSETFVVRNWTFDGVVGTNTGWL